MTSELESKLALHEQRLESNTPGRNPDTQRSTSLHRGKPVLKTNPGEEDPR